MRLIDTDVLIDVQRGYQPALAWFTTLTELPQVPGIVVMELYQSVQHQQDARAVAKLVQPLSVVWPTVADCQWALTTFPRLRLSHRIGLLDMLIAATAMGRGATLVTFNTKHYGAVTGLRTEQPYAK
jgi:predicted nucleic acid-binding protein